MLGFAAVLFFMPVLLAASIPALLVLPFFYVDGTPDAGADTIDPAKTKCFVDRLGLGYAGMLTALFINANHGSFLAMT